VFNGNGTETAVSEARHWGTPRFKRRWAILTVAAKQEIHEMIDNLVSHVSSAPGPEAAAIDALLGLVWLR
jgi:hypothetical protein